MKRNPKQKLEDECDKLWSRIIKIRAKYNCQAEGCGKAGCDPHHISGRSGSVRWSLGNGIYLCRYHHNHPKPDILLHAVLSVIVQAEFDRLEAKAREVRQWRTPDLLKLKQSLKEICDYYLTEYEKSIKV